MAFNLILLDLNLLDINGTATVAAMHAQAPNVPIIVYSGTDDPALRDEALLCGASEFLIKGNIETAHLQKMLQINLLSAWS
jgi:two-component system sensor histidine kinase/response regulator